MNTSPRIILLSLAVLFTASSVAVAQDRGNVRPRPSPNAAVSQTIGTTEVAVTYGRPGLKGRELESLVPEGKVWRTGANESTAIMFTDDVMVGDKAISAGTYSIYSLPENDKLTIIINSKLSWGTQYDPSEDVARVSFPVQDGPFYEWFTIDFDNLSDESAHMNLRWGDKWVAVPITVQ